MSLLPKGSRWTEELKRSSSANRRAHADLRASGKPGGLHALEHERLLVHALVQRLGASVPSVSAEIGMTTSSGWLFLFICNRKRISTVQACQKVLLPPATVAGAAYRTASESMQGSRATAAAAPPAATALEHIHFLEHVLDGAQQAGAVGAHSG